MAFKISSKNKKKQFKLLLAKAEERLKSAKVLIERGLYNDAVSRSYYAFFDAAKEFVNYTKKHFFLNSA